jgi:hypothetical protein
VEEIHEKLDGPAVACLGGARACPPEDCGGAPRYEHMLAVLADSDHAEHEEMRVWVGKRYDPEGFDLAAVNRKLAPLARRVAKRRPSAVGAP